MWRMYRIFDKDGELLYIGMSTNPTRRLMEHSSRAPWYAQFANMIVSKKRYSTFCGAIWAEAKAIKKESPKYNKVHNTDPKRLERFVDGGRGDCNVRVALDAAIERLGSQRKVAIDAGVSAQFISDVVRLNRTIPDRIAKYLGFGIKEDNLIPVVATKMPEMKFDDIS